MPKYNNGKEFWCSISSSVVNRSSLDCQEKLYKNATSVNQVIAEPFEDKKNILSCFSVSNFLNPFLFLCSFL